MVSFSNLTDMFTPHEEKGPQLSRQHKSLHKTSISDAMVRERFEA